MLQMPKKYYNLLTAHEQQLYYQAPAWDSLQRTEAFTFSTDEIRQLKKYDLSSGVYFAVSLALFKQKKTLVSIDQAGATKNIEHVARRYYNRSQRGVFLPKSPKTITRIENKVLELCGYQRCRGEALTKLKISLKKTAPRYPKQRGLCKAFIDLCAYNKIALPSYSSISKIVREAWGNEQQRVNKVYVRSTKLSERKKILALLQSDERLSLIKLLQQEMKSYSAEEINKTLEQHSLLLPIFTIAKALIPQLRIPANTVKYYAGLTHYYKGNQLSALDSTSVQIYLLCYSFLRFQKINDNSIEAFKKRAISYYANAKKNAADNAVIGLANIKRVRQNVSNMLLAIKRSTHKTHVPKATLFRYVPEPDLEMAAHLLLNDELDPEFMFWKEIDKVSASIQLTLRPLFLTLDISILRHDALLAAVEFLKSTLSSTPKIKMIRLPKIVLNWLPQHVCSHLMDDGKCNLRRLEFWLYYQLAQQVKSNKLTLKYTTKYKALQDDLLPESQWEKDKKKILKTLPFTKLNTSPTDLMANIKEENKQLFEKVNHAIANGKNPSVIIKPTDGISQWSLKPLVEANTPNDSLFEQLPKRSIVDIMQFVDKQINFTGVFDSIAPRGAKHQRSPDYLLASILANGLRLGTDAMGSISDLNPHSLVAVEKGCLRMETLTSALNLMNERTTEIPIFKAWNIDGLFHASMDGMKVASQLAHNKAQPSPKYFHMGTGTSSYNLVLNHFPLAGKLIGANEYEGNFAFELCQFQASTTNLLEVVSTDKHGINSINFLLFHLVDKLFAPRIPKPHNERLWGFGATSNYQDMLIKPNKKFNEKLWYSEWDNIQHVAASILTGDANASIIIRKLASSRYSGKTKLAFMQCSNVLKTNFILRYVHDLNYRHAIERSLNRGEAFNRLYRAIALLNKGQLRGRSEIEMMIWDACTRLLASIIQYYNTLILNNFYEKATDQQARDFLLRASPTAWAHINLLGHYQFAGDHIQGIWRWMKELHLEECIQNC